MALSREHSNETVSEALALSHGYDGNDNELVSEALALLHGHNSNDNELGSEASRAPAV